MEKMTWLIRMKFVQLEDLSKENQNTGFVFPVENKVATVADFKKIIINVNGCIQINLKL